MIRQAYNCILSVLIAAAVAALCHTALAQESAAEGAISRPMVEYKSGALRDPFQPFIEKKETQAVQDVQETQEIQEKKIDVIQPGSDIGNLKIQGIIWGGKIPQAIINDRVLSVGDTIEGIEILSIDKSGIALSSGGISNNLPIPGGHSDPAGNAFPGESPVPGGAPGLMERP